MSTTERIRIQVTQDGAKAVRKDLAGIGDGADSASKSLFNMANSIKAAILGAAVRETIKLADAYTDLTNRVRFATRSEQEMVAVRSELFRSANQDRTSIEAVTDTYGKLRLATGALGLSQRDVIELTDTLTKATALSGASSENAANALRQLGQGMASGALRGDELNSILENTPYIAEVIAKSLGKDIGAIRQMGAEGKITGKVIADAFKNAREEIVDEFGKRVPKVGEAFTVAWNVVGRLVGEINDATGASKGLAEGIIGMSEALERAIPDIVDLAKELGNISELAGAFDDILPDMDGDGMTALQFAALMVSTLEDRLTGALRALNKLWAGLSFGLEDDPAGSLMEDLGDVVTGQGAATARVMAVINAQRNQRRGVTTVNDDPNDPRNTLDQRGKDTTHPKAEKLKWRSAADIIAELERENILLQMGNDERKVTEGFIKAFEEAQGHLTDAQMDAIEAQLRRNQGIEVEKRLLDEVEERIDKQLEMELELLEVEKKRHEERGEAAAKRAAEVAAIGAAERQRAQDATFEGAMDVMGSEYLMNIRTFGQEMAAIFGPGGTLHQGLNGVVGSLADAVGYSIAFSRSWDDTQRAIENIGRSIVGEIISSLIRIPIQMTINEAIASGLRAKAAAETSAQAAAAAGAWAPAAAGASLATAGGNSAGATAAIIGVSALALGTLAGAALFEEGGYTGNGSRKGIAGLVHGQEYVVNADATARYRGHLEAMNAGRWAPGGGGGSVEVTILNQAPGVEFETRRVDDRHIEVIARRVAREEAPDAVAADLRSPQSRVGRAMTSTTNVTRKRT